MGVGMLSRSYVYGRNLLSIAIACICGSTALAGQAPSTVIVTPTRTRIVQLVQDAYRMRHLQVVSYQGPADSVNPVLYDWDGKSWKRTSIDEFQAKLPERVVLIGDPKAFPAVVVEAASRCEDTRIIQSFDATTILVEFSKLFDLNAAEISALAKNNGVTVVDRNADLRRYGKYYPGPGFQRKEDVPAKSASTGEIPAEPELTPIQSKIEPAKSVQPTAVQPTAVPVTAPAGKASGDIAPEDK
jgi:hypothetical protein